jgi:hypothetical protein
MAAAEIRMAMAGAHMKLRTVALNLCDIFSAVAGLLRRPVPVDCAAGGWDGRLGGIPLSFFSPFIYLLCFTFTPYLFPASGCGF